MLLKDHADAGTFTFQVCFSIALFQQLQYRWFLPNHAHQISMFSTHIGHPCYTQPPQLVIYLALIMMITIFSIAHHHYFTFAFLSPPGNSTQEWGHSVHIQADPSYCHIHWRWAAPGEGWPVWCLHRWPYYLLWVIFYTLLKALNFCAACDPNFWR